MLRADDHPLRSSPVTPWGSAEEGQEREGDSLTDYVVCIWLANIEIRILLQMPKCLPLPHKYKVHSHRFLLMFTMQQLLMQIQSLLLILPACTLKCISDLSSHQPTDSFNSKKWNSNEILIHRKRLYFEFHFLLLWFSVYHYKFISFPVLCIKTRI